VVIIPARDEQDHLAAALEALRCSLTMSGGRLTSKATM